MDEIVLYVLMIGLAVLHAGYFTAFVRPVVLARTIGWTGTIVAVCLTHYLTMETSPFFRMLSIVTVTLFAMKGLVLTEVYKGKPRLLYLSWMAFAAGWFGMRPQLFEKLGTLPLNDRGRLFFKGFTRMLLGIGLLYISVRIDQAGKWEVFSSLLALAGISFLLHFGILNISAAFWRCWGVDCRELFRSPGLSMSLREFWGKRWNIAFSEMTAQIVYKPLKAQTGNKVALFMAFLFSGLLHELAISVPVMSGYGFPLLYFALHGLLMQAEEGVHWVRKIVEHKIYARIWVFIWLILPMPLLFHNEFISKIVIPFSYRLVGM